MNLLSLGQQHQNAILQREAETRQRLKRDYDALWLRLLLRWRWLFAALRDAKQSDQPLTLSWLYQQQRAQQFKQAIAEEISQFAAHAHMVTLQQVQAAREAGTRDAQLLLQEAKRQ